jgi:hypothetical protein
LADGGAPHHRPARGPIALLKIENNRHQFDAVVAKPFEIVSFGKAIVAIMKFGRAALSHLPAVQIT